MQSKLYIDIQRLLLSNKIRTESFIEESVLKSIWLYGPVDTLFIYVEKWASHDIVELMDSVIDKMKIVIRTLDDLNVGFSKKYVNEFELKILINNSISICFNNKDDMKLAMDVKSKIGECIVERFFNFMNKLINSMIFEYIMLLNNRKIPLDSIRTFEELVKYSDVKKSTDLIPLFCAIEKLYKSYIDLLSTKEFNKVFTIISRMKKSKLGMDFKTDKINELNINTQRYINMILGTNKSVNYTVGLPNSDSISEID
jgi:hypothetical protein